MTFVPPCEKGEGCCLVTAYVQGYPGTVEAKITYIVSAGASLKVIFEAATDKTTPINMTQHSYFNLGGHASGNVLNHKLQLVAYVPFYQEFRKLFQNGGRRFNFELRGMHCLPRYRRLAVLIVKMEEPLMAIDSPEMRAADKP